MPDLIRRSAARLWRSLVTWPEARGWAWAAGVAIITLTTMQALWELINPASLAKLKPLIAPYAGGLLWDPVTVAILAAPAWSLLGVAGILLLFLGRKRKPLIGYAR